MKIPGSGKPSLAAKQFDPASIPPYSVIRCLYQFTGEPAAILRRFVCLAHVGGYAICLKATSKVAAYQNRPERMAGVLFYSAGSLSCFNVDTIIQPDNQLALPHPSLAKQHARGDLHILGAMPASFPGDLAAAVQASVTLSPREQRRILGLLGF